MAQFQYLSTSCQKTTCPLHKECCRPAATIWRSEFSEAGSPADILFIGDGPGLMDSMKRSAYCGFEGRLLQEVLRPYLDGKTFAFTYLVRGLPIKRETLRKEYQDLSLWEIFENVKYKGYGEEREFNYLQRFTRTYSQSNYPKRAQAYRSCLEFLHNDIQVLKPKMIVVMGSTVKDVLFSRESRSVTQLADSTLQYFGIPVRFIQNPSMVTKNPSAKVSWEKQLTAILTGKRVERDIDGGKYKILKTLPEVMDYIAFLKNNIHEVCVDTETLNLNKRYKNALATIQFCTDGQTSYVIPYAHPETPFSPDELKTITKALKDLFSIPSKILKWITHGGKFEQNILRQIIGTCITSAPIVDTQAGAFLLDENRTERVAEFSYGIYTLKQLALDYLNFDGYNKGILAARAEGDLWDLPLEDLSSYGGMDTTIGLRLHWALLEEAERQNYKEQYLKLLIHLYSPMINVFHEIEFNGMPVDLQHLRNLISPRSILLTEIRKIENELKSNPDVIKANDRLLLAAQMGTKITPLGRKPWIFDFAKGEHPQTLFIDVLGLKAGKVGASGIASVDKKWQELNLDIPLVATFVEWSLYRHMMDTFAKKLYKYVDPMGNIDDCKTDCRVRADYLLSSVVTGRAACKKPNLQQVPRADNEAKASIKNIFVAPPGYYMVQLDYKANEMRWVAIVAKDEEMAASLRQGWAFQEEYEKNPTPELKKKAEIYGDIHRQNASKAFNVHIEQVDKDLRQKAKAISFGILYGSSIKSIAKKNNMEEKAAEEMLENFYRINSGIANWKQSTEQFSMANSFAESPHGRRRRLPVFDLYRDANGFFNINYVPNEMRESVNESLRQSTNSIIQGIASDCAYLGAYLFLGYIRENNKSWQLVNAVHDSAVMLIPEAEIKEALVKARYYFREAVMEYMSAVWDIEFICNIDVDLEIGRKWAELEKWDCTDAGLEKVLQKLNGGKVS